MDEVKIILEALREKVEKCTELNLLTKLREQVLNVSKSVAESLSDSNRAKYSDSIQKAENYNIRGNFNSTKGALMGIIESLLIDIELSKKINLDEEKRRLITEYEESLQQNKNFTTEAEKQLVEVKNLISIERKRLEEQTKLFDDLVAKGTVVLNHYDFQTESSKSLEFAKNWAVFAFVVFVSFFSYLLISIFTTDSFAIIVNDVSKFFKQNDLNKELFNITIFLTFGKFIFTKLLIFSVSVYAVIFCVKNYNAQMHNYIINSHKSNALKSAITLLDTAKTEDGKDKILSQATQAIFGHQPTGYYGNDAEPSNPNLITNVVEAISKKVD